MSFNALVTAVSLKAHISAVRLAADIVDRPRNEMTCEDLEKCAGRVAAELGVSMSVIRGEELNEQGFGG